MGFDNIADAAFTMPPLTTVDTHARQLGKTAAKLVLESIREGKPISPTTITKASLVVRSSTGQALRIVERDARSTYCRLTACCTELPGRLA
ncbi:substrate-binding domain-containing protein [Rhizobium sp. CF080]|uniref:substrate-binding domain-containing protein n=1 Tax=Rhizobium sp. (strain CF080) TaxID=1144310 RepID=UPI0009E0566A|nr:substrate-binding domain-containing protein [Rhizobium sp. CF080]